MQKILSQTKNIVILILLFAVIPAVFVKGFFAYLYHFSDAEMLKMFNQTQDVYYKICINSAYISFGITYILINVVNKIKNLRLWGKLIFIPIIYFVLFQLLIFVIIFMLGLFV